MRTTLNFADHIIIVRGRDDNEGTSTSAKPICWCQSIRGNYAVFFQELPKSSKKIMNMAYNTLTFQYLEVD